MLEPRALYAEREDVVLGAEGIIPIGEAEILQHGDDATIVSIGQMVGRSLAAALGAPWTADVIDLRTLVPWDRSRVCESVQRTGRLVVVEEGPYSGGWGTDVVAHVAGECFEALRSPMVRITSPDVPVPYPAHLEQRYLASAEYVRESITALIETGRRPIPWWEKEQYAT